VVLIIGLLLAATPVPAVAAPAAAAPAPPNPAPAATKGAAKGALAKAPAEKPAVSHAKNAAVASVEAHGGDLTHLSDEVWRFAETALKETKSSKVLADYAEAQGFKVTRGVAGMPTAFATFCP